MLAELIRKRELKREIPRRLLWKEMTNLSRSGSESDDHVFSENRTYFFVKSSKMVNHNINNKNMKKIWYFFY